MEDRKIDKQNMRKRKVGEWQWGKEKPAVLVEYEGTLEKSGSKVTSVSVGVEGITTRDKAQAAWPGPTVSVEDS